MEGSSSSSSEDLFTSSSSEELSSSSSEDSSSSSSSEEPSSSSSEDFSSSTSSEEPSSSSSEELFSSSSEDLFTASTSDDFTSSSSSELFSSDDDGDDDTQDASTSSDSDTHIEITEPGFETSGTSISQTLKDKQAGPDYHFEEANPTALKNYGGYGYVINIKTVPGRRTNTATHFVDGSDHFLYSSMPVKSVIDVTIKNLANNQLSKGSKEYSATLSATLDSTTNLLSGKVEVPGATAAGQAVQLKFDHEFTGGGGKKLFLHGFVLGDFGGKDAEEVSPSVYCYVEIQDQSGTNPVNYTPGLSSGTVKTTFKTVKGATQP